MTLPNKRFKSRAMRVLFHVMPPRTKRLVFLSSLLGKVSGEREMVRECRIKIQQSFQLCKDPDAIALPLAYTDKIWTNRPIEPLVCPIHLESNTSDHDVKRTARQIVVLMPCWLVYGTTTKIVQDVCDVLNQRGELLST